MLGEIREQKIYKYSYRLSKEQKLTGKMDRITTQDTVLEKKKKDKEKKQRRWRSDRNVCKVCRRKGVSDTNDTELIKRYHLDKKSFFFPD